MRLVQPRHGVRQEGRPGRDLSGLDQAISLRGLGHDSIERDRTEGKRLVAATDPGLGVPALDVSPAGPPPGHDLQPEVVHLPPVLQRTPAIL